MSHVAFDTTNVKFTNSKTWPRPMNFQDIKDTPGSDYNDRKPDYNDRIPNFRILYIFTEN